MSNHRSWQAVKRTRPEPSAAKRASIGRGRDSEDLAHVRQVEHDPKAHQDGDAEA